MFVRGEGVIIVACTVTAGVLYAATMCNNPLRTDEFITLITVQRPFIEGLLQQEDYSAPLYQLLLRCFVHSNHPSVAVTRAPAVVFAVLCLPAAWWLGRSLCDRRTATLMLPLLALNPVFIFHARDARPYSMFVLFSILSMGSFWHLLRRGGVWNWVSYVTSTVALCWSHYYGFLCLAAQALFAILQFGFQRDSRRSTRCGLLAIAAVLPLVIPALWLAGRYLSAGAPAMTDDWLHRPRLVEVLIGWHVSELFGSIVFAPLWLYASAVVLLEPASCCRRDALPYPSSSSWWSRHRSPMLCLLWIGFGLYVPLVVSMLIRPVYRVSYGCPVIVPVALLTMAGLRRMRPVTIAVMALTIVIALASGAFTSGRGCPQVIQWLKDNCDQETSVYVADWGYCEKWENPEKFGLMYYGLSEDRIHLLPLYFPYGPGVRDGVDLPEDRRSIVVGHIQFQDTMVTYLLDNHRKHEKYTFDTLFVLDVKPLF